MPRLRLRAGVVSSDLLPSFRRDLDVSDLDVSSEEAKKELSLLPGAGGLRSAVKKKKSRRQEHHGEACGEVAE